MVSEREYHMGKFSFKTQSNPLASNMGNHSVGKWDPIPKCEKIRNPSAGLNGMSSFFFFNTLGIKELKALGQNNMHSGGLLVQALHMRGRQLFATKIKKYLLEDVYSYCY